MSNEGNKLGPVDAFSEMFKKHLESSNYNLLINNLILLRNVLKQGVKDSHLDAEAEAAIRQVEETWDAVNVGCGCTRNKRLETATSTTVNYLNSEIGKSALNKIKSGYNLNSLNIKIPDPSFECKI